MARRNIRRAQNAVFDEELGEVIVSRPVYYSVNVNLFFRDDEEQWQCDVDIFEDGETSPQLWGSARSYDPSAVVEDAIWNAFRRFPNGAEGVEIERYSQQEIDALVERAEDWYDEYAESMSRLAKPIKASFKSHNRKVR